MKKKIINIKVDKKLDLLPAEPVFKKKFEDAKLFLAKFKSKKHKSNTPVFKTTVVHRE